MNDQDAWAAITKAIMTNPDEEKKALAGKALTHLLTSIEHRHCILKQVKESIGQLRVDMKYLIFDLHATRKERDEYKRKLEDQ